MPSVMKWGARAALVAALAVGAAALSLIVLVVVSSHQGYRAVSMQTGSMSPKINPGDLAVLKRVPVTELKPGDVITFQAPIDGKPTVTHRIVSVTQNAGGVTLTTRGDANQSVDPWSIRYNARKGWKVVHVIRGLGGLLAFLHRTGGRIAIGALTFFLTLGIMAAGSSRRKATKPAEALG